MRFTALQIAQLLGGEVVGNAEASVSTFAKIEEGVEGALSFMANPKYEHFVYTTKSSIVLVNQNFKPNKEYTCTLIKVADAYQAIAQLLKFYEQTQQKRTGISPQAYISPTATIAEDCYIAPFAYVGDEVIIGKGTEVYAHAVIEEKVTIGEDCKIYPNVTIYHGCKIGNRVVLHAGSVIGADGFGFAPTAAGYDKIPQIGIVTIEDDVEIGANACVDRSTMGSTVISKGVKLDNLVQIAHNVEVGEHTVMSAQVGIAGSTKIGKWCMFGGQVGVAGHAVLGDRVLCGAQAGVAKGLPKGNIAVQGTPAIEAKNFAKSSAVYKQLPEMFAQLNALKKEVEELKKKS